MTDSDKPIAKFLRLQNGDDIVAEVVETEDEHGVLYTLFHPLKAVYMPSEKLGYFHVAFMPWVFPRMCDVQEFVIRDEDILLISNVSEKMNTYYWESLDDFINNKSDNVEPEEPDQETLLNALKELARNRTYH